MIRDGLFLYMYILKEEYDFLLAELRRKLGARTDGSGKNLIARCPVCGKEGKFGVYIGRETVGKKPFMAPCFPCGYSATTLERLLVTLGRIKLSDILLIITLWRYGFTSFCFLKQSAHCKAEKLCSSLTHCSAA